MRFELTLLGTGAALPMPGRFTSAQVLNVNDRLYLIDCGEGTQMRLTEFQIRRSKIGQIFISHLHGDHFYGLMGLLTSFALNDRTQPLDIFSPPGLEEIIRVMLHYQGSGLSPYPIHFHIVDTAQYQLIFEDNQVEVYSIPLQHRIPTSGYLFREKPRLRNILPEKIKEYNIPFPAIKKIKEGADFLLPDGRVIANVELTAAPVNPRAYAYCSDTMYAPEIIPYIKGVDLLYHEATFLHEDANIALENSHSTTLQAATIAREAQAIQLVIGHFSSRYKDASLFVQEARTIFPATVGGEDGMVLEVPFRRET
ncbi:MAG: ribonuclease Z [Saprospiraceae bacterium]